MRKKENIVTSVLPPWSGVACAFVELYKMLLSKCLCIMWLCINRRFVLNLNKELKGRKKKKKRKSGVEEFN